MFGLEDLINDTIAGFEKNELETVTQKLLDNLKKETTNTKEAQKSGI